MHNGLLDREFSPLDRALVDYEPRRPLEGPDVRRIPTLVLGARFVPYAEAPFFGPLQRAQGDVGVTDGEANETARNALFATAPLACLPVHALTFTQNVVNMRAIRHLLAGSDDYSGQPALVVLYRGRFYVADGHHRIIAQALRGQRHIVARVMELN